MRSTRTSIISPNHNWGSYRVFFTLHRSFHPNSNGNHRLSLLLRSVLMGDDTIGNSQTGHRLSKLAKQIDPAARLLRQWPLEGGVSATVTAIEIDRGKGQTQKYVVRQHGRRDLAANPQVASDEFILLDTLASRGLPVPRPALVDQNGEFLGSPCIVLEFIEGEHDFEPDDMVKFLEFTAEFLTELHQHRELVADLPSLSNQTPRVAARLAAPPQQLDQSLSEGSIRDALKLAWPPPQSRPAMLHGDFWPGNILWHNGRLAAVIDWEDAASGDPLADLANIRLELLWAFDADIMDEFTRIYAAKSDVVLTSLPHWDLWTALRPASKLGEWGLEPDEERDMRGKHDMFVRLALEALAQS